MKRRFAILPVALLMTATLAACSGDAGAVDTAAAECAPSGAVSEDVRVAGEFGGDITLDSEVPVNVTSLERSVLIDGDGDAIESDDLILSSLNVFNGSSGSLVLTEGAALQLGDQVAPWVNQAMNCSNIGDRTTVVLPASDVFGVGQVEASGIPDLAEDDALVIVVDFKERLLERAAGDARDTPSDAPTVELDDQGAPTVTMPDGPAPTELTVHTLMEGDGTEVQEGDRVYVHYRGVIWRTGEEFDSSWSRGAPTDFVTTQVIGGFSEALVGHKVGSQMLSIVPAEDGGYGGAQLVEMGHEADDVMVFVLDILGTVPASA